MYFILECARERTSCTSNIIFWKTVHNQKLKQLTLESDSSQQFFGVIYSSHQALLKIQQTLIFEVPAKRLQILMRVVENFTNRFWTNFRFEKFEAKITQSSFDFSKIRHILVTFLIRSSKCEFKRLTVWKAQIVDS